MVLNLKRLNLRLLSLTRPTAAANASTNFALTRHFVLTGDERCPIAGIWSRIDTTAQPDQLDEPSLTRPAMAAALWRAIHLFFTSLHYLPS
ncbi:MAG: hypothetical protein WB439_17230 [Acidobacteriaceae bacterium]